MGRVRYGVHAALESEATALIMQALSQNPAFSSKSDILTPAKEAARRRREVYVRSGVPDGSVRRGNIRRAVNPTRPHLNATEASVPVPNSLTTLMKEGASDRSWIEEYLG
jgi:hypothetical protein